MVTGLAIICAHLPSVSGRNQFINTKSTRPESRSPLIGHKAAPWHLGMPFLLINYALKWIVQSPSCSSFLTSLSYRKSEGNGGLRWTSMEEEEEKKVCLSQSAWQRVPGTRPLLAHCSGRGSGFDLRSQSKFPQNMFLGREVRVRGLYKPLFSNGGRG